MYSQKVDLFLNIFLQNILGLEMKSRIVISRYNLVMHSFFARNNYSALSPPSPGAQNDRKFGKCYAKKKTANSLCKALFGQETSPTPCTHNCLPLFGPQTQAGPGQRTGHNSEGKNTAKGKPGEVEARASIPASIFHTGIESMAPKTGCTLQKRMWAVRNSAGEEEMSEHKW